MNVYFRYFQTIMQTHVRIYAIVIEKYKNDIDFLIDIDLCIL